MSFKHNKAKPPKLGKWLLESFCSYDFLSTALWDMEELFHRNVKIKGIRKAKLLYLKEAFGIVIYLFFKGKSQYSINKTAMLKHNFLISYRSFFKHKSTFFINLIGLTSGLACTLLIYLWVADELSMNKFHENSGELYQVMQNAESSRGIRTVPYTPGPLSATLMEKFPEVEYGTSVLTHDYFEGESYLSHDRKFLSIKEQFIDEQFFKVFTFPMSRGNSESIFRQPNNVLISQDLATRLFLNENDAIGKTVLLQNEEFDEEFIVSGVFENVPNNSTLEFDILFNLQKIIDINNQNFTVWYSNNTYTYMLLKAGTNLDDFNQKIYGLVEEFEPKARSKVFAQKFDETYLNGSYENGEIIGGRIAYVGLFSLIAMVILIIACINFINLSTAKAMGRLKEIGVKKTLGAKRKTLVLQYFTEAFLMTTLGIILAFFTAYAFLPFFNQVTGKNLYFEIDATLVLIITGTIIITTLLTGGYPALYLSRLNTIASLKGKLIGGFGDSWARKGLVVFQFSISVILIVSVLIVSKQIAFIQSKNLGYNRDNVLGFTTTGIDESTLPTMHSLIQRLPGVVHSSYTAHTLTGDTGRTGGISWPGQEADESISMVNLEVGIGFTETMGIELVEGRTFETERSNEIAKILFNQTAIKAMGLEDPIGKIIKLWGREKQIIGIVKDFHTESLYEPVSPTFIQMIDSDFTNVFVKIQAGTELQTIDKLESIYSELSGGMPFDSRFVDRAYQAMYEGEKQVASLSKSFALIAIIISCLGLLGLTTFTAERRSKEIGIRKVLGASLWKVVHLLSTDVTKMIAVSLAIGLPISYFIAQRWIQDFAFGIDLSIEYFLFSGIITLIIAWLTVSIQTFKSARANPVESLRSE